MVLKILNFKNTLFFATFCIKFKLECHLDYSPNFAQAILDIKVAKTRKPVKPSWSCCIKVLRFQSLGPEVHAFKIRFIRNSQVYAGNQFLVKLCLSGNFSNTSRKPFAERLSLFFTKVLISYHWIKDNVWKFCK